MVFSSNLFLFAFLPAVLTVDLLLPARFRNHFLFLASTFFYLWGSGPVVFVFLAGIALNHAAGALIHRARATGSDRRAAAFLAGILSLDLGALVYYKYLNFFGDQLVAGLSAFGVEWHRRYDIALPIGVSFFVFQAMTYPIEIYRREQQPARLVDVGAYLALFAHLIAGPVVRYSDISAELRQRSVDMDDRFAGLERFAVGLGKKVLLANPVGGLADQVFGAGPGTLTTPMAWIGTLAYGLQIYFDFSGYSDMAIGMARMLGFHFPENFDHPYRSASVTEFWRRWHMTLSRWFRDFLYIPLGGNRRGAWRTHVNLFTVFFVCGLWHGASWNFVVWGMFHGALLVAERSLKERYGFTPRGLPGQVATVLLVFVGWVFFRAPDLTAALSHLGAMFGRAPASAGFRYFPLSHYLTRSASVHLAIAAAVAWVPLGHLGRFIMADRPSGVVLRGAGCLALLLSSAAVLSTASFNPFIYFRF